MVNMKLRPVAVILVSLLLINFCSGATPENPVLQISSEVVGMEPGGTGYLKIILNNDGTNPAYNTEIVLDSVDSPLECSMECESCNKFSLSRRVCLEYPSSCYEPVGDVYGSDSKQLIYKIEIPENITTDYYSAYFSIRYSTRPSYDGSDEDFGKHVSYKEFFEIENSRIEPNLIISDIVLSDEEITPGEVFQLILTVKNSGVVEAENVELSFDSDTFSTHSSSNVIVLDDIFGGESQDVVLELVSDSSVSTGMHESVVNLSYESDSDEYSSESSFGANIEGGSPFELLIKDVSFSKDSSEVKVRVTLANIGTVDADSVVLSIRDNGNIGIGSVNQDFVGDLVPGDYSTSSFTFTLKGENMSMQERRGARQEMVSEGLIDLGFEISFTNQLGQRMVENITKEIIYDSQATTSFATPDMPEDFKQGGGGFKNQGTVDWTGVYAGLGFIGVVFVVVVSYVIIKKRKKK